MNRCMKKYKLLIVAATVMVLFAFLQACSVEPEYYSQSTPEMFFDTQSKVYQRMACFFDGDSTDLEC